MGSSPPPPPRPRGVGELRWGLGDALLAYLIAGLGGIVGVSIAVGVSGGKVPKPGHITLAVLVGAVVGQYGSWFLWILRTSWTKGRHSLARDFGLRAPRGADWTALPVGYAFALVAGLLLWPISHFVHGQSQEIVDDLKHAHGDTLFAFVVLSIFVAPIVEELFFRGVLLRALQRRMSAPMAVALAALAFALAHVFSPAGVDWSSGPVVPALVALGLVSGTLAVRTGNLSRSMLLHAGFNLVAVLAVLANH